MLAPKTQRNPPRLSSFTQTRDHIGNLAPIDPHTFPVSFDEAFNQIKNVQGSCLNKCTTNLYVFFLI